MREAWKNFKLCVLAAACVLLLGVGVSTEASEPAPAQVQKLEQIGGNISSVKISWNAVIEDNIRYKVELSETIGFSSMRSEIAKGPETTFAGLSAGKDYYVRVSAFNYKTNVYGKPSKTLKVVTAPEGSSTQDFRQTDAGTASITLKWNKNQRANAYQLEYYKSGDGNNRKIIRLEDVRTYTVKRLARETEYTFRLYPVRKSASGYRAVSGTYSAIYGRPVPGKVTGLTAVFSSPSDTKLNLSWNKREHADCYQYQIYTASGKKDKKLLTGKIGINGSSQSLSDNKLQKAQFLKVRIRGGVNLSSGTKYGVWSGWLYFSKQPEISIKNVRGGQKLNWKKVPGADSYTVKISQEKRSGYKKDQTVSRTSITVAKCGKSALRSGKTYYYTVVANKKAGKKTYHGSKTHCYSLVYR